MSYILEALKKSQQARETQIQTVAHLHASSHLSAPSPQNSSKLWIWGLSAAVFIALVASAVALYALFFNPATPPHRTPEGTLRASVENTSAQLVQSSHVPSSPKHIPKTPRTAMPPPQKSISSVAPSRVSPPLASTQPKQPTSPASTVAARVPEAQPTPRKTATTASTHSAKANPDSITSLKQEMQQALVHKPQKVAAATPYPPKEALPGALRQTLPPLKILLYYFTAQAQKRFVILDGEKLHQGEQSSQGVKVIEIGQQGLILEYNGQRFFQPR